MTDPLRTLILPRSALSVLVVAVFLLVLLAALSAGGASLFFTAGFACVGTAFVLMNLNRPMVFVAALFLWFALAFVSSPKYFPMLYYRFSFLAQYTDELLLIPLYGTMLLRVVFRQPLRAVPAIRLWVALLVVTALSGFFSKAGIVKTADFAQSYFRHVVLLIVVASCVRPAERHCRRAIAVIVVTLVVQLVMNLGWLLEVNPLPNSSLQSGLDFAIGTFGLSGYVTYLAIMGLGLCVAVFLEARPLRAGLAWVVFAAVCIGLVVMGMTKHAIPIAALSMGMAVVIASKRRPWARLTFVVVTMAVLMAVAMVYDKPYRERQRSWLDPGWVWRDMHVKVASHRNVFSTLTENRTWIFGEGPAQFSSAAALRYLSPLFVRHFYQELEAERFNPQGSVLYNPRTGMLSLLGDVGLLGLGLYLALFGLPFCRVLRQFLAGAYDHCLPARRLALAWLQWAVFYFILNLLIDYLNFSVLPVLTWTGAGLVWDPPPRDEPAPEATEP